MEGIFLNNIRKSNYDDGTYSVEYDDVGKIYTVFWKENGITKGIEVSEEIADLMYKFKLENKSRQNEYDRHTEHSKQNEITLNKRAVHKIITVEEIVIENRDIKEILSEIKELTEIQKRRFALKFYGFSLTEIAKIEGCSVKAISLSIKQAERIIKNFYKNF